MKSLQGWEEYLGKLEQDRRDAESGWQTEVLEESYPDCEINASILRQEFQDIDREIDFAKSGIALAKLAARDLDIGTEKAFPDHWEYHQEDGGPRHRYLSEKGHTVARRLLRDDKEKQTLLDNATASQRIARLSMYAALAGALIGPIVGVAIERFWPDQRTEVVVLLTPPNGSEAYPAHSDLAPPVRWREPYRLFGPCSDAWPGSYCPPHPAR